MFLSLSNFSKLRSTPSFSRAVSKSLHHYAPFCLSSKVLNPSRHLSLYSQKSYLGSSSWRRWSWHNNFSSTSRFSKVDQDSDADFQPKIKKPVTSSIHDVIKQQVDNADVVLYMKGSPSSPMCGFSFKVVQILNSLGVEYQTYNVLADETLRQGIKDFSNWPTIPQLYVKGEFVGGCDIIENMYRSGELQALLSSYSRNTQSS
ncbi:Probable monothiol glutaredoxin-2 [Galdieria sulphuraria]|uniref:Uncharacterized monothiol glutaredoxin ycf64 n=1 Tax=Galdieria sulphuraria TaxID=130081 RepID=M2VWE2_GALSU|nr:monothiol glutaredoxin [Galdieria sulphuraria]EME27561.1 monothiol glutaredoxin [Galdieria sulphuraria]GJD09756.1 Probable monothiol glutaredoxin-2 [Galdieria sulphuraria]|eukprot:XP_005704081.1 monothiol glutaredoxin [Galdieria sulphuraria]